MKTHILCSFLHSQLLAVAVEGQDVVQLFHMKWWLDEDCTCPVGALMQLEPVTAPQVRVAAELYAFLAVLDA